MKNIWYSTVRMYLHFVESSATSNSLQLRKWTAHHDHISRVLVLYNLIAHLLANCMAHSLMLVC
jgi:hypothetical protein